MKHRYLFDTEKLIFDQHTISIKQRIKALSLYILAGIGFALIIWVLFLTGIADSPKNLFLKWQNNTVVENISNVNSKFDSIAKGLNNFQNRDDKLYRVISEIEPISSEVRKAGIGGTDKYTNLDGFENSDLLIELAKKGDQLLRQLNIQSQSFDTIIYFVQNKQDSMLAIPGILPVNPQHFRITDIFGTRVHPIRGVIHQHTGIDFAASVGRTIVATGNGKVVEAQNSGNGYGNCVVINHGYGFKTLYAHMHKIAVKEGDIVKRGQKIGTVGSTGSSTGPHLHYEVIYYNLKKNPDYYYSNDLSDQEYKEMIQFLTRN